MAKPFNFPKDLATVLAALLTYQKVLPQGSPASPLLANIVASKMDREMILYCKRNGLFYTRYADDLTISSRTRRHMTSDRSVDASVHGSIRAIVEKNGFVLNESKTSFSYGLNGGVVTGIRVSEQLHIGRRYIRNLRAIAHEIRKNSFEQAEARFQLKFSRVNRQFLHSPPSLVNHINGKLAFLLAVKGRTDSVYENYYKLFQQLSVPMSVPAPQSIWDHMYICEDAQNSIQGTAFLLRGYGIVTCAHVVTEHTRIFTRQTPHTRSIRIRHADERLDLALAEEVGMNTNEGFEPNFGFNFRSRDRVRLLGFPNYRYGDSGSDQIVQISGHRTVSLVQRVLVNTGIVAGNSGGPVLDMNGRVIGVAVTGAENPGQLGMTENHSFIPIEYLDELLRNVA